MVPSWRPPWSASALRSSRLDESRRGGISSRPARMRTPGCSTLVVTAVTQCRPTRGLRPRSAPRHRRRRRRCVRRARRRHQDRVIAVCQRAARRPGRGARRRPGGLPQGLPQGGPLPSGRQGLHLALPDRGQPLPQPPAPPQGGALPLVRRRCRPRSPAAAEPGRGGPALVDPVDPAPRPDEALASRRRWGRPGAPWRRCPSPSGRWSCWPSSRSSRTTRSPRSWARTTSAVASRLFRAMRQLEKALAGEGGGRARAAPRGSDGLRVS